MTTETVYRFRCDGPQCPAAALGSADGRSIPEGWTQISSTAHIRHEDFPLPPIRTLRGRTRANRLSYWDAVAGQFRLHLCGDHGDAFTAHLPITNGGPGKDAQIVNVACSCGARLPATYAMHVAGSKPSSAPERQWWSHLPADLQWYATREAVA